MRSINSIVLLCNGISFAIQIVVFLIIGSFADFGSWRPNILIALSLVAWAIGFAWLGVHDASKWEAATGLYIVGLIAYQTTLTFWTAAFPGLARNTAEMKEKADELVSGAITRHEYDYADMMKRSQLANIAFYVQSVGEIFILVVIVGVMFGVDVNASTQNNNWGLSVLIAFATGVWVLVAIPWFIFEKRRPGQDPAPRNIITAGLWQLYHAGRQILQLKQSLIYLVGGFYLPAGHFCQGRIMTEEYVYRILSPWRLSQHDRHSHRHTAKHRCGLQHTTTNLSLNRRHCCPGIVSPSPFSTSYTISKKLTKQAVGIYGFW